MIAALTRGIKVSVETFFQSAQSNARIHQFVFAYRITIENKSDDTVCLRRRHWSIVDADGRKREVEGEGVVGEQPVIYPGKKYQYTSGCNLFYEIGKMYGNYQMENLNTSDFFDVKIPEFVMVAPFKLN